MDELTFRGEGTFEIKLQKPPRASAEAKTVMVTLHVCAAGFPAATAQMQMPLSIEFAEQLLAQLQPALTMARVSSR
jgi:hypothetical protein